MLPAVVAFPLVAQQPGDELLLDVVVKLLEVFKPPEAAEELGVVKLPGAVLLPGAALLHEALNLPEEALCSWPRS